MSSQNLLVNSKHFEQLPSKFWGWTHEQFLRKMDFLQLTLHFFVKVQKTKELGEGPFLGDFRHFELKLKTNMKPICVFKICW